MQFGVGNYGYNDDIVKIITCLIIVHTVSDEKQTKLIFLQSQKMSGSINSLELAETSETQVHLSTVQRNLARSGLCGRVLAKNLKLQQGNEAKRLNYVVNIGTEVPQNGSRCSGLMSPNVNYLAGAEGRFFTEGFKSSTLMSVCKKR